METTAYTPPPQTPETSSTPLGERVDDDGELTRLDPGFKTMLRIQACLVSLPVLFAAFAIEMAMQSEGADLLPFGTIIGVVAFLALVFIIRLPSRRYIARGYQISADRLRVVKGILWRSDTVVPFGRVQHIDVDQGPLERAFGLATMTLYTAGSHNASVHLPGLNLELANDMREEIRAHIKRETM